MTRIKVHILGRDNLGISLIALSWLSACLHPPTPWSRPPQTGARTPWRDVRFRRVCGNCNASFEVKVHPYWGLYQFFLTPMESARSPCPSGSGRWHLWAAWWCHQGWCTGAAGHLGDEEHSLLNGLFKEWSWRRWVWLEEPTNNIVDHPTQLICISDIYLSTKDIAGQSAR